jgi:NADPH-dependent 2,4-dienoyl-CoA reductase/sulfur reductase-like enzyme
MKVLVLGGVAAGTKIAAKLMREDRANEVTVLNKGRNISYAGCGLPYYVGHVIENKEELFEIRKINRGKSSDRNGGSQSRAKSEESFCY